MRIYEMFHKAEIAEAKRKNEQKYPAEQRFVHLGKKQFEKVKQSAGQ